MESSVGVVCKRKEGDKIKEVTERKRRAREAFMHPCMLGS
jgi:hypothetical protein